MNKTLDFLTGIKILEEVESLINGKLAVVRDLAWGTYIKGGGLTQSGGVAEKVWKTSLKEVKGKRQEVKECLILGLGGGGIAKIVRKNWPASPNRGEPDCRIVGVDVDPIIVELGKKYLELDKLDVEIVIQDALDYLTSQQSPVTNHFDLVCVDMYVGDKVPEKFETENFLNLVRTVLASSGVCVFNRLYYGEKKKEAEEFHIKLIHVFKKVRPVYPEANVMYVCSV